MKRTPFTERNDIPRHDRLNSVREQIFLALDEEKRFEERDKIIDTVRDETNTRAKNKRTDRCFCPIEGSASGRAPSIATGQGI